MKKILFVLFVLSAIIAMSSCEYDDSNDIDIITPVDSTATGISQIKSHLTNTVYPILS